jgi:hypothetical protein
MGYLEIGLYVGFGLFLLYGLKQILYYFMWSWNEQGKQFTVFIVGLFLLYLNIFAMKHWFPSYHSGAILLFIGFLLAGILYRFVRKSK